MTELKIITILMTATLFVIWLDDGVWDRWCRTNPQLCAAYEVSMNDD